MSGVDGSFDLFKSQFPLVDRYLGACERQAKKVGYVRTLGGYPIRVAKAKAYKACNMIVQGTEGEMVKDALNLLHRRCEDTKFPVVPIMTIHDEIIFQTKKGMAAEHLIKYHSDHLKQIANIMNLAGSNYGVRTTVDAKLVVNSWADSRKINLEY